MHHIRYWSGAERTHVEAARDAGVHLIFLSGNDVFWRVRWEKSTAFTDRPSTTRDEGNTRANENFRTMVCVCTSFVPI